MVRENFAELFFARLATGDFVRNEIPAAEAATTPGDARFGRRSEIGKGRARSEWAGHQRHYGDRLVRSVTGWQTCRGVAFHRRQRRWHAAHLRNRDRQSAP